MQPKRVVDQDQTDSNVFYWNMLLAIFLLILFLITVLFFATSLNVKIGAALGVNLRSNDQLVIYDANCRKEGEWEILSIIYWTPDSAPLILRYNNIESPIINSPNGINTLDVTVREGDTCPDIITLIDRSRSRLADSAVEVRE